MFEKKTYACHPLPSFSGKRSHCRWLKRTANLEMMLDNVVATNLTVIQKNLWDPVKRKALVFNRPMEVGDATWQVLRKLEVLLDQSQRRFVGSWNR